MRAPTIPEAHLAAVIALTLALVVILGAGGLLIGPPIAWQLPTPLVLIPMGVWLRFAWVNMQLQHRVAAAYAERLERLAGAPGAARMTPEELRRALGVEGRPATRPVDREEQAQ